MKTFSFLAFSIIFTLFIGCRKFEQEKIVAEAKPYIPNNLYPIERLPTYFNRVAVLPNFHNDPASPVLKFSDDIFLKELSKVGIFETVQVPLRFCKKNFGKERISSTESLPENFLQVINDEYGANGVLFVDIHSFNSYRPMSLGIRSKLVDLKSGEYMWAIDESIDAGDASVMVSANLYQRSKHVQALSKETRSSILQSPRLFTKFAAHAVFQTLPIR